MTHRYPAGLKALIFGLLAALFYGALDSIGTGLRAGWSGQMVASISLFIVLVMAGFLATWSLASITTNDLGISVRVIGIPIVRIPWNEVRFVQQVNKPYGRRGFGASDVSYFVFGINTRWHVGFTNSASDLKGLLEIIGRKSVAFEYDLYIDILKPNFRIPSLIWNVPTPKGNRTTCLTLSSDAGS